MSSIDAPEESNKPMLARGTFWEGFAASTLSSIMLLVLTFFGAVVAGPVKWVDVSSTIIPLGGAFLVLVIWLGWKPFKSQWINDWNDIRTYNEIPLKQRFRELLRSDASGISTSLPGLVSMILVSVATLFCLSFFF